MTRAGVLTGRHGADVLDVGLAARALVHGVVPRRRAGTVLVAVGEDRHPEEAARWSGSAGRQAVRNTHGPLRKPFPPSGLHQLLLQMETLDPRDPSPSWTDPLADYDPTPELCTAPRSEQKQRDKPGLILAQRRHTGTANANQGGTHSILSR